MPKKRNTGVPKITQLPSGAYHALVYSHTDPDGKRRYESFTGYDYNQLVLDIAQFKADKKRDKIKKATEELTLGDAMQKYLASKTAVLSPSTYRLYKGIAKNHLLDLQKLPIDRLTAEQVQVAINKLSMDHAPKTVRNIHGFLTAVFSVFRPDFTFRTTLPQKKKAEIQIPTEEEIKKLFELTKGTVMELPILLAACCGMRRSEICALKWENVNFKKGVIIINRAVVLNEDNDFVEKATKTTAGTRTIRMFPFVKQSLQEYKDTHPDTEGYIVISPNRVSNQFYRLIRKNGFPEYRFHDLRHYTVSVMLSLNIPKKYIADYVGHESENMIDKVYGHIMASKKTSVEDQLQEYFEKFL